MKQKNSKNSFSVKTAYALMCLVPVSMILGLFDVITDYQAKFLVAFFFAASFLSLILLVVIFE